MELRAMSVLINRIKGRSNKNSSHLGAAFRAENIVGEIVLAQIKSSRDYNCYDEDIIFLHV